MVAQEMTWAPRTAASRSVVAATRKSRRFSFRASRSALAGLRPQISTLQIGRTWACAWIR